MPNVLLVDDHAMFREMMTIALNRCDSIRVVGEAADAHEAVERTIALTPDIVLLDYKMPGVGSFRSLVEKIRSCATSRVVVLSGLRQRAIAQAAAAGGARGYILKTTRLTSVSEAVLAVARGEIWVDPNLGPSALEIFRRALDQTADEQRPLAALSEREVEVLAFVSDGDSNRQIARKLDITEETVKSHVTGILSKLNVPTRMAAALEYLGVPMNHAA
jgi:two-component system nitrate/nitrite response regulator NarL